MQLNTSSRRQGRIHRVLLEGIAAGIIVGLIALLFPFTREPAIVQERSLTMYYAAIRCLSLAAALGTLALMVSAARPWGDNDAYQDWRGYAMLFLLAVWATLPYLGMLLLARRAMDAKTGEIFVMVGALVITVGGLAAYVDAIWLHPDPQGGLAFMVVPFYQGIILGLLAVLLLLVKERQTL